MSARHLSPAGAAVALAGAGVALLGAAGALWLGTSGHPAASVTTFGQGKAVVASTVWAPPTSSAPALIDQSHEVTDPENPMAYVPPIGDPIRVSMPSVSAPVVPVGLLADGSMQIPDDVRTVGWWVAGAAPGDRTGNVVLVGHLDSARSGLGAFVALLDVPAGSQVILTDERGHSKAYTVVQRQQIVKSRLPASLFDTSSSLRLVLITCGGRFDPVTHSYEDNIVVIAEPA